MRIFAILLFLATMALGIAEVVHFGAVRDLRSQVKAWSKVQDKAHQNVEFLAPDAPEHKANKSVEDFAFNEKQLAQQQARSRTGDKALSLYASRIDDRYRSVLHMADSQTV
jgi:hypothetical protein